MKKQNNEKGTQWKNKQSIHKKNQCRNYGILYDKQYRIRATIMIVKERPKERSEEENEKDDQ